MNRKFINTILLLGTIGISSAYAAEQPLSAIAPTAKKTPELHKSTWSVSPVAGTQPGFIYSASGKIAPGHLFGFFKSKKDCSADLLWVRLSSTNKDIKKSRGEKVNAMLVLDPVFGGENNSLTAGSVIGPFPLEFIQYGDVPDSNIVAVDFSNLPMNSKFFEMLSKSKNIAVKIESPAFLADMLQRKVEEFDLTGLAAAKSKATAMCKKK